MIITLRIVEVRFANGDVVRVGNFTSRHEALRFYHATRKAALNAIVSHQVLGSEPSTCSPNSFASYYGFDF